MLPPWLAVIEQVPVLRTVTSTLAVLQTAGVVEAKLTGRREVDCAAIVNGETPGSWLGIASNVIVCEVCASADAVKINANNANCRLYFISAPHGRFLCLVADEL